MLNFQGDLMPIKDCDLRWKILTPLSQTSILGKKGGSHLKLVKNSTNSDLCQIVIGGESSKLNFSPKNLSLNLKSLS